MENSSEVRKDEEQFQSLENLFLQCLEEKISIDQALELIDSTINNIKDSYSQAEQLAEESISSYYCNLWYPDFHFRAENCNYIKEYSKYFIHSTRFRSDLFYNNRTLKTFPRNLRRISKKRSFDKIAICGLTFAERKNNLIKLKPSLNSDLILQIDVSRLPEGKRTNLVKAEKAHIDLWLQPEQTRVGFYRERLEQLFPEIDLETPSFSIKSLSLQNPLIQLSETLSTSFSSQEKSQHLFDPLFSLGTTLASYLGKIIQDVFAGRFSFLEIQDLLFFCFSTEEDFPDLQESSKMLQKAETLLSHFWNQVCQIYQEIPPFFWHHLYGHAWIGITKNASTHTHQAHFLLAAYAATQILGPPEVEGVFLEHSPVSRNSRIKKPLRTMPENSILLDWIENLEELGSPDTSLAALHGRGHRVALIDFVDILVRNGLVLREDEALILLGAIHLHDISLWIEYGLDQDSHLSQSGPLSAEFLEEHIPKLLSIGLTERDVEDLNEILLAFPSFPKAEASPMAQKIGGLLAILDATQWGRERVPQPLLNLPAPSKSQEQWFWAKHLLSENPKEGYNLYFKRVDSILEVSLSLRVKVDQEALGGKLAEELSAWAHHLLRESGLAEILEQSWNLRFRLAPPIINVRENLRFSGWNCSPPLAQHFSSQNKNTLRKNNRRSTTLNLPGVLVATSFQSNKIHFSHSLSLLTVEETKTSTETSLIPYLLGGVPQWSDFANSIDVPRRVTGQVLGWLSNQMKRGRSAVAWLTSSCGNGKTTVLMRIAYQLVREQQIDILWRSKDINPETPLEEDLLRSLKKPTVIILDDAHLVLNLTKMIRHANSWKNHPPLYFIIGYQSQHWRQFSPFEKIGNISNDQFKLDYLTDAEVSGIYQKLRQEGLVQSSASDEFLLSRLRRRDDICGDLLTAVLLVTDQENNFSNIIKTVIQNNHDPIILKTIAYVATVSRHNSHMSSRLLAYILEVEEDEFRSQTLVSLYQQLRPLIGARDSRNVSCRNQKIANLTYRHIIEKQLLVPEQLYLPIIKSTLEVGQFGDWRWEQKLSTMITQRLDCRELRRQCYLQGLKLDTPNPFLWQTWARFEEGEGNIDLARLLFYRGTLATPKDAASWQAWALMELKQYNFDQARIFFRRAVEADSKNSPSWQAWALMEERQNNYDQARELFQKSVEADPADAHSWQAWALLEERQSHFEKARELFQKSINADPTNAPSWQAWALMEERQSNYDQARELFQKGVSADPKHIPSLQAWALMEERQGEVKKARELFNKGVDADANNTHSWQAWALMEERQGQIEKARELFQKSIYIDAKHTPSWQAWALMEERQKQLEQAEELFQKGLKNDPKGRVINQTYQQFRDRQEQRKLGGLVETPPNKLEPIKNIYPIGENPKKGKVGEELVENNQDNPNLLEGNPLEKYGLLNEIEILEHICHRVDQVSRVPKVNISCPPSTLCIEHECPYYSNRGKQD